MYRKIMVPLDGSELAECVLPHVEAIASGCKAGSVIFVRAVEPFYMRLVAAGEESMVFLRDEEIRRIDEENRQAAETYLQGIAGRVKYDTVEVKTEVIIGKVADILAEYAAKNEIDLILIATHGRSGISRWVWGSVADRILRSSCAPVFMVRAPGCVPGF